MKRSNLPQPADEPAENEGGLSDYEDLLEQAEETDSFGDPDLKNEKKKVKKTRAKKALAQAAEFLGARGSGEAKEE